MIILTNDVIKRAFSAYVRVYDIGKKWDIANKIYLYSIAEESLSRSGNYEEFNILYENLKCEWKVFRGCKKHWDKETTFQKLLSINQDIRRISLASIKDSDWPDVWKVINDLYEIKINPAYNPSLVAISKFLHFWNPKLFVIFDSKEMEECAFRKRWLSHEWRKHSVNEALNLCRSNAIHEERLIKYIRILLFARQLMKDNPKITEEFINVVSLKARDVSTSNMIHRYDAAAFEWLILGLIKEFPNGI